MTKSSENEKVQYNNVQKYTNDKMYGKMKKYSVRM